MLLSVSELRNYSLVRTMKVMVPLGLIYQADSKLPCIRQCLPDINCASCETVLVSSTCTFSRTLQVCLLWLCVGERQCHSSGNIHLLQADCACVCSVPAIHSESTFLLTLVFVFPLSHLFSTYVLPFCVCLLVIVAAPSCTMTQSLFKRLHPDHFLPFLPLPSSPWCRRPLF